MWVTCGANGTEHAVADQQMTAGRTGVYVAQCGVPQKPAPTVIHYRRAEVTRRALSFFQEQEIDTFSSTRHPIRQP
ncbi:MAG: hypothetical protein ACRDST_02940 [Pseudonocardiaceae bacterium]